MGTLELVIFDCDGVLVDSEPIGARVLADLLAERGVSLSATEVRRDFAGRSLAGAVGRIRERFGLAVSTRDLASHRRRLDAALRADLRPVPGIAAALDRIPQRKCVASNADRAKVELCLARTSLGSHFDGRVYTAEQVARAKPRPDLLFLAARASGVEPARCAVVEDTVCGIRAARAAGMHALGFAASTSGASLAAAGARVFSDMSELPELLASLHRPSGLSGRA